MKQIFIRTSIGVVLQAAIVTTLVAWSGGCSEIKPQPKKVSEQKETTPKIEALKAPKTANDAINRYKSYSETADQTTEINKKQAEKTEEYFK